MSKQRMTLIQLCVHNAGGRVRDIRRGARVCEFVLEWAAASMDANGPITNEQFAAIWAVDVRTIERRRRELRELFPGRTPQELADRCLAELGRNGEREQLTPELRVAL